MAVSSCRCFGCGGRQEEQRWLRDVKAGGDGSWHRPESEAGSEQDSNPFRGNSKRLVPAAKSQTPGKLGKGCFRQKSVVHSLGRACFQAVSELLSQGVGSRGLEIEAVASEPCDLARAGQGGQSTTA